MTVIPEPSWETLTEGLLKGKETAIILGATDSGKSCLARYLIGRLVSEGVSVCLIDSDVGQSSLGLPGTISMKEFKKKDDLEDFVFERMSFIGTLNPAKRIIPIVEAVQRLAGMCRKTSEVTVIDTSGLIYGEIGKALKLGKIKAVRARYIIAVQREDELEHILRMIENVEINRIKISRYAEIRNVTTRTNYRRKKFDAYFHAPYMSDFLFYVNETKFFYDGKPSDPKGSMCKKGSIIALNRGEDTIALGIVEDISDGAVTFRSPIRSLKKINRVVLGDIAI